jgi:hypothetical protein
VSGISKRDTVVVQEQRVECVVQRMKGFEDIRYRGSETEQKGGVQ